MAKIKLLKFPIADGYKHIHQFISKFDDCTVLIVYISEIGYCRCTIYDNCLISLYISELSINKHFRLTGQGSLLLQYIIDLCKINNIQIVSLNVKNDSWMKNWYKTYNFIEYEMLNDNYITLIKTI